MFHVCKFKFLSISRYSEHVLLRALSMLPDKSHLRVHFLSFFYIVLHTFFSLYNNLTYSADYLIILLAAQTIYHQVILITCAVWLYIPYLKYGKLLSISVHAFMQVVNPLHRHLNDLYVPPFTWKSRSEIKECV